MKPPDKAALREARLSARLKANLARRKDQARGRESPGDEDAARPSASSPRGSARTEGEENPSS